MSKMPVAGSAAERREWGRSLREDIPLEAHGDWTPDPQRDPVGLIIGQETHRLQYLIPLRHERMNASAFAFYRGSAVVQAADLASTPVAGIDVQLCGDAHLSNFGLYGSPERRLVFDINDFDETLPGPFEWDVKRLAASFVLAGRDLGHDDDDTKKAARAAAATYRETMERFASMRYVDTWYAEVDVDEIRRQLVESGKKKRAKRSQKTLDKARSKDNLRALKKLAVEVGGRYRIKADHPNVVPVGELAPEHHPDAARESIEAALDRYRDSLPDDRATLFDRYRIVDFAMKVVGVGSVGTRCYIALFAGRDKDDPLFLQIKEAGRSVLEDHLPRSRYRHSGKRVVEGQRLMQSASDIFLGWTESEHTDHDYYVRQMWDMKGSPDIESYNPRELRRFAEGCGWTLAHGHARTGSAAAIAGYLGDDDTFDRAVARYSMRYADQAVEDYESFKTAASD